MNNTYPYIKHGDCLEVLSKTKEESVDLIYLDPPFFTQKNHTLSNKTGEKKYSFSDLWADSEDYMRFMFDRLEACNKVLKKTGSIFIHCDRSSIHLLRIICDNIFGEDNFKSEIIWHYKRWANSSTSLLPAHQNILYYTKSGNYTFNKFFQDYSESTNIDQILQNRQRDHRNKSVYARDENGEIVSSKQKNGVPLSDVWEIPFLNPKAKERVGYPTQKPILLIERIINLASNEGDIVLDPFCGSGTTVVAATLNNRCGWGIDVSEDAVKLAESRLSAPQKTESNLLKKGKNAYKTHDVRLDSLLEDVDFVRVSRNKGIDAILKEKLNDKFVYIRLQKENESLDEAVNLLAPAIKKRDGGMGIIVVCSSTNSLLENLSLPKNIKIINSTSLEIKKLISDTK